MPLLVIQQQATAASKQLSFRPQLGSLWLCTSKDWLSRCEENDLNDNRQKAGIAKPFENHSEDIQYMQRAI